MKIFITYYIISGLFCLIYLRYNNNYEKTFRDYPFVTNYFSKKTILTICFLSGFIQMPIEIIIELYSLFLQIKIWLKELQYKRIEKRIKEMLLNTLKKILQDKQQDNNSYENHIEK